MSENKNGKILTRSVLRNAIIISSAFLGFAIVFNLLFYYLIQYQLISLLDAKIRHELEHITTAFRIKNDSLVIVRQSEFDETDLAKLSDNPFFLQIYKMNGQQILGSRNLSQFNKIDISFPQFDSELLYTDTPTENEEVRTVYKKLFDEHKKHIGYIQLSTRKVRVTEAISKIRYYNIMLIPLVLVIIISLSVFISKKTLTPVKSIIDTANKISAENLSERFQFDTDPDDEMYRLKLTLNNLFERLESQVNQISSFADNAAHQLLTPITAINSELDYAIKLNSNDDDLQKAMILARGQSSRLETIIKTLLIIAKSGKSSLQNSQIFSFEAAVENDIKPFYKSMKLSYSVDSSIFLKGRKDYFILVMQNLIDNAVKYSNESASISIKSAVVDSHVEISVSDNGIGIAEDEKEKVFERFYRSPGAENLGIAGYGLGLSLVKSIVHSMNGSVHILNNNPRGTIIVLKLPYYIVD